MKTMRMAGRRRSLAAILARSGGDLRMIEAPSKIAARFGHPDENASLSMEATMTDKIQILMAAALATLGLGALLPAPAFATDGAHPALLGANGYPVAPRLEPRLAPERLQIADSVQSTNSASSSASASASSSVTATGGKQGKCKAEASAHAKANDVEDSDHDLKVVEGGDGCSAKAESSATVKPRKQQSE
jgi:hypothetical protein